MEAFYIRLLLGLGLEQEFLARTPVEEALGKWIEETRIEAERNGRGDDDF